MTQIKIVSNPYKGSLEYFTYKNGTWDNIKQKSVNSRLREIDDSRTFLPFRIREIIDTIIKEYHVSGGGGED